VLCSAGSALLVARQQQAKSWELRTAMSMARLWRDQGKRTEAHDLLAPVYGWFTEGFETLVLQNAKALLDALTPPTQLEEGATSVAGPSRRFRHLRYFRFGWERTLVNRMPDECKITTTQISTRRGRRPR
jgi:hypothetical protein